MNSLDVQDWELVPNDGFLDDGESNRNTTTSLMNYILSSPPKSVDTSMHPKMPNQLALEPTSPKLQEQREADHSFEQGKSKSDLEESRDSFNIWKLSLFGVAAAGVYIIISWGNSNKQHQQNQKNHRQN